MKPETTEFLRGVLSARISWLAQTIGKGAENGTDMAGELVTCSAALADVLGQQPATAPVTPRANELLTFIGAHNTDLAELQAIVATGQGKQHPGYALIRAIRAFVTEGNPPRALG